MQKIIIIQNFGHEFNMYKEHLDGPNQWYFNKLLKQKFYIFISKVLDYDNYLSYDVDVML